MKAVPSALARFFVFALLAGTGLYQAAAAEVVGDIASDFSLRYRTNRNVFLDLSDFPGSVVMVEFFYADCPHCQEATPRVESDIVDYYRARGGNADGIPVVNIYADIGWFVATLNTTRFIQTNGLDIVVEDWNYDAFQDQFGGTGTPHIVIINGVANSPSHRQWEIVYNAGGFDSATTINLLRSKIDSVKAPNTSPRLGSTRRLPNGDITFNVVGQRGRTNTIECITAFPGTGIANWTPVTNIVNVTGTSVFQRATSPGPIFYRARVR